MRTMGLDVGSRRIGVALSDELGITAQPHCVISAGPGKPDPLPALVRLMEEREVEAVVVGLPLAMGGGDRGSSSRRARALGQRLAELTGVEVLFVDERFTTAQAERVLLEADVRRADRKGVVDKVAAALILQGYLDGK
jgi:putative holliday junction resolvase